MHIEEWLQHTALFPLRHGDIWDSVFGFSVPGLGPVSDTGT
jgi:hypothetical protein